MNTDRLNWRSLLVGFVMGSAALVAAIMMLANLGLIGAEDLALETSPFVGYLLIVLLSTVSVGGSLLGYELSRRGSRRGIGSSAVAIAVALLAVLLAPERPLDEETRPARDASAEYRPLLDYARVQIRRDDPGGAIKTLLHAAGVVRDNEHDMTRYCSVGVEAIDIAEELMIAAHYVEAAAAYAMAISFSNDCAYLDRDKLVTLRGIAQAKAQTARLSSR